MWVNATWMEFHLEKKLQKVPAFFYTYASEQNATANLTNFVTA